MLTFRLYIVMLVEKRKIPEMAYFQTVLLEWEHFLKLSTRSLPFVFLFKSRRNLPLTSGSLNIFPFPLSAVFVNRGDKGEEGTESEKILAPKFPLWVVFQTHLSYSN